jgi:DNA ligase D-like protein (predicted ligase)
MILPRENERMPGKTTKPTRLPDWVEPELATLTEERFADPGWVYERKLDGERCLAFADDDGVRLLTRNQKSASASYPELVEALEAQASTGFVVDGEVVSFDRDETSFSLLQQRIHVAHPSPELRARIPVYYYLFDIMFAGGTDVRERPLRERKELLLGQLSFAGPLRFTEPRTGDGVAYWKQACRERWEGIIAKRGDAPYRAGRQRDWLKFKCVAGQEFVVGGFTDPRRSRTGFGALLLGYYDADGRLTYAGKVGTGFDEQTLHALHDELASTERADPPFERGKPPRSGVHWVEPRLVAEIGFSEWTTDGLLRHPRFQGTRRDKQPSEVVRESA